METILGAGTSGGDTPPGHLLSLGHSSRSKSSVPRDLRSSSSRVRVLTDKARMAVKNMNLKADIEPVIQAGLIILDTERVTTDCEKKKL